MLGTIISAIWAGRILSSISLPGFSGCQEGNRLVHRPAHALLRYPHQAVFLLWRLSFSELVHACRRARVIKQDRNLDRLKEKCIPLLLGYVVGGRWDVLISTSLLCTTRRVETRESIILRVSASTTRSRRADSCGPDDISQCSFEREPLYLCHDASLMDVITITLEEPCGYLQLILRGVVSRLKDLYGLDSASI